MLSLSLFHSKQCQCIYYYLHTIYSILYIQDIIPLFCFANFLTCSFKKLSALRLLFARPLSCQKKKKKKIKWLRLNGQVFAVNVLCLINKKKKTNERAINYKPEDDALLMLQFGFGLQLLTHSLTNPTLSCSLSLSPVCVCVHSSISFSSAPFPFLCPVWVRDCFLCNNKRIFFAVPKLWNKKPNLQKKQYINLKLRSICANVVWACWLLSLYPPAFLSVLHGMLWQPKSMLHFCSIGLCLPLAFVVCYLLFVFLAVCSACDAVNKLQRFFPAVSSWAAAQAAICMRRSVLAKWILISFIYDLLALFHFFL